ncbi:MAG: glycosyltransferase family 2 protein [Ruminococcus sp.]|jgi:rhamnosyltransferase|nr:glycosyltransferase family 2 protein [Ruminococcus sp.]
MKTLAGIVLYNPDIQRLKENISAIRNQVDQIVFVDNGSTAPEQYQVLLNNTDIIIRSNKNEGIAAALNKVLQYAKDHHFDWFITLDQDSVCKEGLIAKYYKYIELPAVGILTCNIIDRNFNTVNRIDKDYYEIKNCITSASFCNTAAFAAIGGFDEWLFIDAVDFDVCSNLRANHYKIYHINFDGLLHEVGHGKKVWMFGEKIAYNHSPFRNYYIARNNLYLIHKYPDDFPLKRYITHEIIRELIILFYENKKIKKISKRWKGIRDALQKMKEE